MCACKAGLKKNAREYRTAPADCSTRCSDAYKASFDSTCAMSPMLMVSALGSGCTVCHAPLRCTCARAWM
jgi:hypothetical protein